MVLPMPSPFKHPKTGVYWLRARVPADLRSKARGQVVAVTIAGQAYPYKIGDELKVSLRTKQPAEAKAEALSVVPQFDAIWRGLREAPQRLSLKSMVAIAGGAYRRMVGRHEENPGPPEPLGFIGDFLEFVMEQAETDPALAKEALEGLAKYLNVDLPTGSELSPELLALIQQHTPRVTDEDKLPLLKHTVEAQLAALGRLRQNAEGDFSPDEYVKRFPSADWRPAATVGPVPARVTLTQLVDAWATRLKKPKPQTEKRYRGVVKDFIAYLGHEDAEKVTDMDLVRWHRDLVEAGQVTHDTFIKTYKAAIGTIFKYGASALGGKVVSTNPAAGLQLEGVKKVINRDKLFTADEATTILRATLRAEGASRKFAAYNTLAQRWVPWICAYTGARPGEICQLRGQDFVEVDGIKCVALLPDAGTIKTGQFRVVPLHPHLLEQGIWEALTKAGKGPLFYNPALASETPWVQTVQMLGEWVRDTAGVKDPDLSPNHAWRHWFRTKALTAGIPPQYISAFCGWAPGDQSQRYGKIEVPALKRELDKLPTIRLDGKTEAHAGARDQDKENDE